MPHYLIAPSHETSWGLDATGFEARLRERWPDAQVRAVPGDSNAAVDFRVEIDSDEVDAWMSRDGAALHVFSPATYEQAAALGAWWRTQAPDAVQLWLFDTSWRGHTEL
jgi:hypothetical protein